MTIDTFSGAVLTLIFISFVIERGLSVIFESRPFIVRFGHSFQYKVTFAFVSSLVFVFMSNSDVITLMQAPTAPEGANPLYRFDARFISELLLAISYVFTALIVAGGSKASLKLFRDVMGIQSSLARDLRTSKNISAATISSDATSAANGNKLAKNTVFELLDKSSALLAP